MRISDWSSDVCSSDLKMVVDIAGAAEAGIFEMVVFEVADRVRHIRLTRDEGLFPDRLAVAHDAAGAFDMIGERDRKQFGALGSESCRERVCKSVYITAFAPTIKKKQFN